VVEKRKQHDFKKTIRQTHVKEMKLDQELRACLNPFKIPKVYKILGHNRIFGRIHKTLNIDKK